MTQELIIYIIDVITILLLILFNYLLFEIIYFEKRKNISLDKKLDSIIKNIHLLTINMSNIQKFITQHIDKSNNNDNRNLEPVNIQEVDNKQNTTLQIHNSTNEVKEEKPNEKQITTSDNNDNKIWVQKTEEGFKKLEVSNSLTEYYLLKENGNIYTFHIKDFDKLHLNNIIRLYGELFEYPIKSSSESIKIKSYPCYKKHSSYYLLLKVGEITVE